MMSEECRIEYIKLGATIDPNKYEALLLGPALWGVLGISICNIMGERWMPLAIATIITLALFIIWGFCLARKKHTIKIQLSIQALIYLNYVFQTAILQAIAFIKSYGFNFYLIILYIPIFVVPILLSVLDYRYFCKKWIPNGNSTSKAPKNHNKALVLGATAGVLGMNLAKLFLQNIDQSIVLFIVIILLEILNLGCSIGLISIHRLYLIHTLRNSSSAKELFQ